MTQPPQRTPEDGRRWMAEGTTIFLTALDLADDDRLAGPTALAGWTGKHIVAHVGANAEAVGNLVHWARTGEPTPMYSSMDQRAADIESRSHWDIPALRDRARSSAAELAARMAELTDEQWATEIVTAQGRRVPATEVPWMRTREVMIHAVDLGTVGFADLPADFLAAQIGDVVGKRSGAADEPGLVVAPSDSPLRWSVEGTGDPVTVTGSLADLTAYLTGRAGGLVTTPAGDPAPALPRWL